VDVDVVTIDVDKELVPVAEGDGWPSFVRFMVGA
jgi:hypothetical protein